MVGIAAAVLVDEYRLPSRSIVTPSIVWSGMLSGLPGSATIVRRLETVPVAIDVDDLAGFLAEDQQVAEVRLPAEERQVREREDVGEVREARQCAG